MYYIPTRGLNEWISICKSK